MALSQGLSTANNLDAEREAIRTLLEIVEASIKRRTNSNSSVSNQVKNTKPSGFLKLPKDIRRSIYLLLIRHEEWIWFEPSNDPDPILRQDTKWGWRTRAVPTDWRGRMICHCNNPRVEFTLIPAFPKLVTPAPEKRRLKFLYIASSLMKVNRVISTEVQSILYKENFFIFHVGDFPHQPSLDQFQPIFGLLGLPHRIHVLQYIQNIELNFYVPKCDYWTTKRSQLNLENFVRIIKKHLDDGNQKSRLKKLYVYLNYCTTMHRSCWSSDLPCRIIDLVGSMYSLEALTALRGIEKFRVRGVRGWYARCLELYIQGEGGEVREINYPFGHMIRVPDCYRGCDQTLVPSWEWWKPKYDWEEFAERNGIDRGPKPLDESKAVDE